MTTSKPVPVLWQGPLHDWVVALRASGRSSHTVYLRRAHVSQAARAIGGDPRTVEGGVVIEWLGSRSWSREMRRSVVSSLRGFWSHMGRPDVASGLPSVAASDPAPRPMPEPVVVAAAAVNDRRVALMVTLAAYAGLRRAEVAQVHRDDLQRDLLGWSLLVHGKGGKRRVVPLSDDLATMVRRATASDGWAFPSSRGGHISPGWVGKLVRRHLPGAWTLHTARHRYATVVHHRTHDLIAVQSLLGHASVATTQRYVATDAERLRAAAMSAAA